jgi:hypothetical protein
MTPFFEQLEVELDRVGHRLHRRRRRRTVAIRVAAAAAVVVAVLAGVAVIARGGTDRATADVHISEAAGVVSVELQRGHEPADDVAAKLREVGLTVQSTPVGTGPSQVGTVVGLFGTGSQARPGSGDTLTLDANRGDTITLLVGEATTGDYAAFTDATAPGEPLHCLAWPGRAATALAAELPANLAVTYQLIDGRLVAAGDLTGYVVTAASALSATNVRVTVDEGTPVDRSPCE